MSTRKLSLPPYFATSAADDSLRKCFLCLNPTTPSVVTHITAVPNNGIDISNPVNLISIDSMSADQIRKICSKFGRGRPESKAEGLEWVNQIAAGEKGNETFSFMAKEQKRKDLLMKGKTLFRIIGVVFSSDFVHLYAELNNRKKVVDYETGVGRNNECFYNRVCDIVNDDFHECHKFVLTCEDNHYQQEYNALINDEDISEEEHPSGTLPQKCTASAVRTFLNDLTRVRNQIVRNMKLSGNGSDKCMDFVDNAIRKCKLQNAVTANSIYYYFMQCKFHRKVGQSIDVSLPDKLQQSSTLDLSAKGTRSNGKRNHDNHSSTKNGEFDKLMSTLGELNYKRSKMKHYQTTILRIEHNIELKQDRELTLFREIVECQNDDIKQKLIEKYNYVTNELTTDQKKLEKVLDDYYAFQGEMDKEYGRSNVDWNPPDLISMRNNGASYSTTSTASSSPSTSSDSTSENINNNESNIDDDNSVELLRS